MSDETPEVTEPEPQVAPEPEVFTVRDAIANAARILRHAEMETNLAAMERLDELANTWLNLGHLINLAEVDD